MIRCSAFVGRIELYSNIGVEELIQTAAIALNYFRPSLGHTSRNWYKIAKTVFISHLKHSK